MRLPTEAGAARESSKAVARRAVELGVTLIDTAHMYGWGANEELLAEALHPYPDGLLITTKVGITRSDTDPGWRMDGRPAALRAQVEQALGELQAEGKVARIGLSEVGVAELERARAIVEVASVQNRYNVLDREHEPV